MRALSNTALAAARNAAKTIGAPALGMVSLFVGVALLGDVLQPYDPTAQDLFSANQTFSSEHLLGTDHWDGTRSAESSRERARRWWR